MPLVWKFIVSFLVGSIPFAKVAMLGTGVDVTKVGSKNPGFNNVLRAAKEFHFGKLQSLVRQFKSFMVRSPKPDAVPGVLVKSSFFAPPSVLRRAGTLS